MAPLPKLSVALPVHDILQRKRLTVPETERRSPDLEYLLATSLRVNCLELRGFEFCCWTTWELNTSLVRRIAASTSLERSYYLLD